MPFWIISLLSQLKNIKGVATMALFLPSPAKFWREYIIVILLGIIAFGGWYYSWKTSALTKDLLVAEININTVKENNKLLLVTIEDYGNRLTGLVTENDKLEDRISDSLVIIDQLNARSPETIIRTVYETALPEACDDKFEWLLLEAIKMKDMVQ